MKKYFQASFIHSGLIGGAITVDENGLTFHTNKLTVESWIRKLRMNDEDIDSVSETRFLLFPEMQFHMKNKEVRRFIIFSPSKMKEVLKEKNIVII